ncbi:MAG: hypothetical protein IKW16_02170, partial [Clostridia bacterium]|nr:hypothetical protein [Clostridia bacterium]
YGDTKLTSLQAGVTSGAIENRLVVRTASGSYSYVGGIVGFADSASTGNRLTIKDCVVTDADISTHQVKIGTAQEIFKIGAGGIVGFTQGDNTTSYTDIIGCHVVKAYLHSANGFAVAGIVGNQGEKGALAVEDCAVGTKGAGTSTTNVTIEGKAAMGGIISYAFATASCSNSYIDCYVYEDVLIRRADRQYNDKNELLDSTTIANIGSAIGGIVGAVTDQDGKATFNGQIEFYGTINLGDNTNSKNVGGAVGYMGTSAKINADCDITIGGKIQATGAGEGNPQGSGENIGGFAGVSNGAILDGAFYIYPVMATPNFDNVGGFIGNNQGKTEIARTATIYTYLDKNGDGDFDTSERGSIVAKRNVGGLIGINSEGTEIIIGIAQSGAESFGAGIADIELGAEIDGKGNIGGFVGGNYGKITTQECSIVNYGNVGGNSAGSASSFIQCVGGVVGYVGPNGNVIIEKHAGASIINMGVVGNTGYWTAYQEYVGGVIGASYGSITINGNIANQGHVYGYRYVGGVIGVVGSGTISGELNNGTAETSQAFSSSYGESEAESAVEGRDSSGATVTAVQSVGGVIGVVMENATITGATMTNYGTVTADSHDIAAINNVSNLGGVIGLHYGVINNSVFENYGAITAENFAGGAIGVSAGTISGTSATNQSEFVNHATLTFYGDTALGGAVGYITDSYEEHSPGGNTTGKNSSTVSYTYFSYEPVDSKGDQSAGKVTVQATGVKEYTGNIDLNGGVGGVFGAIDSNEIKLVEEVDEKGKVTLVPNWVGNSFFIHGDVIGGTKDANGNITISENVDSVGGVVGIIKNAYVNISDMLVYHSIVAGN